MIKINEKLMALFIGVLWVQNCGNNFRSPEGENSRTRIGFNTFCEGSNKMRFKYCMNSQNSLLYIRVIQGHTGGNFIAPEFDRSRRYSIQMERFLVP